MGTSPERDALGATFTLDGVRRAHINAHMNSHVQAGPAKAHDLPRVAEYVAGAKVLTAWVAELEAAGYVVTVTGDLNWAWSARPVQWAYSPVRVFGRIGFVSQYDYGVLPRPKGDARAIEYVLFRPNGYDVTQRFVTPEKSDHPWVEVTLTEKES